MSQHASTEKPKVLDLFSGIGGFSLAFEAEGFETIAFCEKDPEAASILAHHWPKVPNLGDVKNITLDLVDGAANLCDDEGMAKKNELDSKYNNAPELYQSGLSVGDVADFFNVTRQAMWKILRRRGVNFRANNINGNDFYHGGATFSKRAHHLVEKAVLKGILKPLACEICGGKAEAHHDDYAKPLDVRWLCKKHHYEWHKTNKAKNGKESNTRTPHRRIDVLTAGVP